MWNIWIYKNQVFKKVRSNPFLVIEKATLKFIKFQKYLFDPYPQNEG